MPYQQDNNLKIGHRYLHPHTQTPQRNFQFKITNHNLDNNSKFAIYKLIDYICTIKIFKNNQLFSKLNTMDFVNRLKFFMENGNITISQFADTCRIPRPTMSQILNGRNKKVSDELISKIHTAYPELSVLWLMFGEGEMLTNANTQISEPQNAPSEAELTPQPSDSQNNTFGNSTDSEFTKTDSEKFSGTSTLFPYENGAESHDNIFGSMAADAQQFYVTTHEVIEFESGANDQGTAGRPAPTDKPSTGAQAYNADTINNNPIEQNPTAPTGENTAEKKQTNNISLHTAADKRITNIVVFYSDNSFQSFYPTMF